MHLNMQKFCSQDNNCRIKYFVVICRSSHNQYKYISVLLSSKLRKSFINNYITKNDKKPQSHALRLLVIFRGILFADKSCLQSLSMKLLAKIRMCNCNHSLHSFAYWLMTKVCYSILGYDVHYFGARCRDDFALRQV